MGESHLDSKKVVGNVNGRELNLVAGGLLAKDGPLCLPARHLTVHFVKASLVTSLSAERKGRKTPLTLTVSFKDYTSSKCCRRYFVSTAYDPV